MANVWQKEEQGWVRRPLTGPVVHLKAPQRPAQLAGAPPAAGGVTIRRYGGDNSPVWVLLSERTQSLRINGQPVLAGISVLHDRDEILLRGQTRFYYTTEELAKVETFPGAEGAVFCARCRQQIKPGTPAVRCPACGHWCEQSERKPCWTYGTACPMCDQPTAFDNGFRWTPEGM